MSVYLIGQIKIHEREEYSKYQEGFLEIFSKYNGELLVVEENHTVIEGEWPFTRTVVIRFPDENEATRWYRSPEYQKLAKHRFRASMANIVMVNSLS
jgi:uncharacterized protein (DUF1330 family)